MSHLKHIYWYSNQIPVCAKGHFHGKAGHVELNWINLNRTPAAAADPPPIPDLHAQDFEKQMKITFFCFLIC